MKQRIEHLRTAMREELQLEAMFIASSFNRSYMTGFTGSAGYVLITPERSVLFTDFRYMSQAPKQAADYEVIEHKPNVMNSVKEVLQSLHIRRLGFEQNHVSFGDYHAYGSSLGDDIELVATDRLVENLRMVKEETELTVMREAAELADNTFTHILNFIRPGVPEREIALEIEFYLRKHGAASSSFTTIVASGERSALPHGVASERVLGTGEFVKLDFGAYYKGYCSDITRTVVLGKPTEKHKEIYDIVLEAQMHALAHIKPGMTGREADALARDVIVKHGYGDFFGHGLGHGLGMEIHEAPRLSMHSDTILQPGMTVTVEPGIYLPGFGGVRIEDDVVVTASGVDRVTHSTKDFIVIDG
jgi:Xaa-Pro aminopeptidase